MPAKICLRSFLFALPYFFDCHPSIPGLCFEKNTSLSLSQ